VNRLFALTTVDLIPNPPHAHLRCCWPPLYSGSCFALPRTDPPATVGAINGELFPATLVKNTPRLRVRCNADFLCGQSSAWTMMITVGSG
jgi:hypothetical protein